MQKWQKWYALERKNHLRISRQILIERNTFLGNGSTGIHLYKDSESITISHNSVTRTGKIRTPDYRKMQLLLGELFYRQGIGKNHVPDFRDSMGVGILLSCLTHHNILHHNNIGENHSYGLKIELSHDNRIEENVLEANHDGIYLTEKSARNTIVRNRIRTNRQCGIGINSYHFGIKPPPVDNLIAQNDLIDNPFNAYDTSGRAPSRSQILQRIRKLPWPDETRKQFFDNPALLEQTVKNFRKVLRPGTNQWDDGSYGNHYSDFDENAEGFMDRNRDGRSENPYPISGGNSVDRYPLSTALINFLISNGKDDTSKPQPSRRGLP
jgi:parallel beta-helix repeat protein